MRTPEVIDEIASEKFWQGWIEKTSDFLGEGEGDTIPLKLRRVLPKLIAGQVGAKIRLAKGQDWYQDIATFVKEVEENNYPEHPYIPEDSVKELRGSLIIEETSELLDAMDKKDLVKIADGGADAIVVILGAMVAYGIDLRPIWDEVHKTNMAKKGGKLREDGKLLKPEGWKPPDIAKLIKEQQNEILCS